MPSQDMVLGCYYLTVNNIKGLLGSSHYFANLNDVILAYNQNKLEIHSSIWVRIKMKKI
jgi:DNA-directed RNA polymerase subunit beta'